MLEERLPLVEGIDLSPCPRPSAKSKRSMLSAMCEGVFEPGMTIKSLLDVPAQQHLRGDFPWHDLADRARP